MRSALQRHLHSIAGEQGLADLLGRLEKWSCLFADAWKAPDGAEGVLPLRRALAEAIADVDRPDLATARIRLRPATDGEVPAGVACALTRAIVEHLAAGDARAERDALEALAAGQGAQPLSTEEYGFCLANAEILFEDGQLDRAISVIDEILATNSLTPYLQQILYRALLKQKEAGQITASPRVSLVDLKTRFCDHPFTTLLTNKGRDATPNVHLCNCPDFLPYPVNPLRDDSGDLWNGPVAQEIRRSILDGDFSYCSPLMCPYLLRGTLPKRDEVDDPAMRDIIDNRRTVISSAASRISLGHDDSCNIACPSCRTEILTVRNSARQRMDTFVDRHIVPLMENTKVTLFLSADGDPIGSKHYRRLLHGLDAKKHAGVQVYLKSNGLLITPREWEDLSKVHPMIKGMIISIDAAERETYEYLRRPGKWETITSNMDFIAGLRRSGAIWWLGINFVVQKKNYEQMPAFVELGQRWSADRVTFSKLFYTPRAGSFDIFNYKDNAIAEEDHPDYRKFLNVLQHPIMREKIVELFNVKPER